MTVVSTDPHWLLRKPVGNNATVLDNLAAGIGRRGQYVVEDAGNDWKVERVAAPPKLLEPMSVRVTTAGVIGGSLFELTPRATRWLGPDRTLGAIPDPHAIVRLEASSQPQTALHWADTYTEVRTALMSATADTIPNIAARIANVLLSWCPNGHLTVWAKNVDYLGEERVVHMIATAQLLGLDAAEEIVNSDTSMLIAAEDILTANPGVIYLDLVDAGTSGWAFDTLPFIFIFDFGEYREWPALDRALIERLHSLSLMAYSARLPPTTRPVINLGPLGQAGLREWFVEHYNQLADRLLRLESFRTDAGRLRPVIQNQTMMTVARILNATAHLFAVGEVYSRLVDFWDLVDLYAGLRDRNDVSELFTASFWNREVMPGLATLPDVISAGLRTHARRTYLRWVHECTEGIAQPSRRGRLITIGDPGSARSISPSTYFAKHLAVRRNTLHGYYPRRLGDYQAYVAGHDGHLPDDISQWGRWMVLTLLARPDFFFDDYRYLSPSGDGRTR